MQPFGTILLLLLSSAALVLLGHVFRLLRWEQFIRIYEYPQRRSLLRAMAGGYAVNFLLPFHVGDFLRAALAGRKMKTGTGFAFATVIMDRFLDVWVVALLFGGFRLAGLGGAAVLGAARYYLVFALLLAAALCWWCCCGTCSSGVAWPCAAFSMIPSSWTALCSAGVSSIPSRICAASTCGGYCSIRFSCGGPTLLLTRCWGRQSLACGRRWRQLWLGGSVQHAVRRQERGCDQPWRGGLPRFERCRPWAGDRLVPAAAGGYVCGTSFAGTSARRPERCSGAGSPTGKPGRKTT